METEGTVGKYPEGLRELVVRAAQTEGVWEAVGRYGVPYSTVKYWCARARKLAEGVASAGEVGMGPGEGAGIGAGRRGRPVLGVPMAARHEAACRFQVSVCGAGRCTL